MPFQYSQYQSPYEGSIGELMARKGDIAAHALRQQGQGRANLIASVGQAAGQTVGTIGDLMQQRQAHRQAVQQKMLTQEQARAAGRFLQESVARNKQPDGSVNHDAVVSELNASPFAELGIAEEYLKQAKGLADLKPKPVEAKPTPTRAVTTRAADGTETTQIVPDTPGQSFTSAPVPKPVSKPNVGSFEDFVVRKYGENPTPEQIAEARKVYQQADDRPITIRQPGSTGLTPNMESQVINRLAGQWTTASKPARDLERQVSLMEKGIDAARRGDLAQGAQTVLVTFQKILDPTSVVRESEFDRSAAGQSLINRVKGAMERLKSGGAGIPLGELEKFAALAREAAEAQRGSRLDAIQERIGKVADRYKIPRELVFEMMPEMPAPAGGANWIDLGNGVKVREKAQ